MDLPTYTNIWRIEKRLYKLYDFRLPAPLPITWIAVFTGITVPYIFFLVVIGVPFNHNLVWLYVLPPGVLTWLTTRPVIESKRLPELVSSQLRYLAEPRTWCRMAPFAEKDNVVLYVRVWHRYPPRARPETVRKAAAPVTQGERVPLAAVASESVRASQVAPTPVASWPPPSHRPVAAAPRVQQRGTAQSEVSQPRAVRQRPAPPEPGARPAAPAREPQPDVIQRPAPAAAPSDRRHESGTLEVSHDQEPDPGDMWEPRPSSGAVLWPSAGAAVFPLAGAFPEAGPFPEAGAFPEVGAFPEADPDLEAGPLPAAEEAIPWTHPGPEADPVPEVEPASPAVAASEAVTVPGADAARDADTAAAAGTESGAGRVLELEPLPDPDPAAEVLPGPAVHDAPALGRGFWRKKAPGRAVPPPASAPAKPSPVTPGRAMPAPATPRRSMAAKVAAMFIELDEGRPVPSVERALSGPGSRGEESWQRRVKVVTGGHGPGQRDREALDRHRARRPLAGPRRIAVLGCIGGAGQSVTALMVGRVLADVREVPVAALDLNPGDTSLAARIAPATSVRALLAGQGPDAGPPEDPGPGPARRGSRPRPDRGDTGSRLDVIAVGPGATRGAPCLGADDYRRLADLLAARYPLTMIDPAPSGLTRVLSLADQLVLVVPASPEAATSLANTQQWLTAHGYDELAACAVTVVNGVSRRASQDVLLAESVARGRCRAIVRVPWDNLLSAWPDTPAALQPQTRLAYSALAGVLVAGLDRAAAVPRTPVRGRSAGEHPD